MGGGVCGKGEGMSVYECDFCGHSEDEVTKLIVGPGVSICEDCIATCAMMIISDRKEKRQEREEKELGISWR